MPCFFLVSILSILRSKICFSFAESRKIKKKMTHHELISEVLMTLRFPAEASDIKRRIESLIERELLGTGFGDQLDMSRKVTIPSIWRTKSWGMAVGLVGKHPIKPLVSEVLGATTSKWTRSNLLYLPGLKYLWVVRCRQWIPEKSNLPGRSGHKTLITHFGRSRPRRAPKLCSWIQSISTPKNPGKRCSHFLYDSTVPDKEDSCDSANFRSQAIEKEVADAVLGSIWKAPGRRFRWLNSINSGDGYATSKLLHFEPPGLC